MKLTSRAEPIANAFLRQNPPSILFSSLQEESQDMSLNISCPHCHQMLAVQPASQGQQVSCPHCRQTLMVPAASSSLPGQAMPPGSSYHSQVSNPAYGQGAAMHRPAKKGVLSNPFVLISLILGGLFVVCLICGGVFVMMMVNTFSREPQTNYANLMEGREGFETTLTTQDKAGYPVDLPPENLFAVEHYSSPAGELAAYVSPDPGDGQKHPAIIWIFGGFDNSIGETAWQSGTRDNDQSASAFREAGIVMMYPSLRGGNDNPGYIEGFYGEVDDVLAAYDHLASKDYVDPDRIYLGGHSTGGTLVMLAAAASDRFRAVFAFGPVDDVTGYGFDILPFSLWNNREVSLRNPIQWLHAMDTDVFVLEGTDGNVDCLWAMERATSNPKLHFHEVGWANHFNILAPVNELLAQKILADTGRECSIELTDMELQKR